MQSIRRILHPSDFSPASRPAFTKAVALAKTHRAQLLVAHVLSIPTVLPEPIMVSRVLATAPCPVMTVRAR